MLHTLSLVLFCDWLMDPELCANAFMFKIIMQISFLKVFKSLYQEFPVEAEFLSEMKHVSKSVIFAFLYPLF